MLNTMRKRIVQAASQAARPLTDVYFSQWHTVGKAQELMPSIVTTRVHSSGPRHINYNDILDIPPNLKLSIKCKELIRSAQQTPVAQPEISLTVPVIQFTTGETICTISLDPVLFKHEIRRDIAHAVVRWQLACRRQGAGKTKQISEVRGSGRKVRPQKGGGTARAGHRRPPHWRGGAKAHGPKGNRDWSYKLHKKVRDMGLRVVLSAKLKEGKLFVVDSMKVDSHKTVIMSNQLQNLGWTKSTLFVDGDDLQDEFVLATRNIPGIKALWGGAANCYDIVKHDILVISRDGLSFLEKKLIL